ncbi:hypothetical protein [Actinomadura chibensis]|uniref:Uncharacterized protein n=1 Tax=Actinomadura chibensis TaxID=392828 RepID=A0A5D0N383_9ACTN|nr:hypothetical protein [Actinomadura chibensis]TYB38859.1 hypothetical protein FXF69_41020 [Actinomadura chibensis]
MVAGTAPPLTSRPPRPVRATRPARPARRARGRRARGRRLGWAFVGGAAAMAPWIWGLARTMPSTAVVQNWSTAWVGLDLMEAAALLGTGVLLLRHDDRYRTAAAVAATLLVTDAWFDVTTATPGAHRALSVALAAGAELPIAILCAALSVRAFTPGGAADGAPVKDGWRAADERAPDG